MDEDYGRRPPILAAREDGWAARPVHTNRHDLFLERVSRRSMMAHRRRVLIVLTTRVRPAKGLPSPTCRDLPLQSCRARVQCGVDTTDDRWAAAASLATLLYLATRLPHCSRFRSARYCPQILHQQLAPLLDAPSRTSMLRSAPSGPSAASRCFQSQRYGQQAESSSSSRWCGFRNTEDAFPRIVQVPWSRRPRRSAAHSRLPNLSQLRNRLS